MKIIYFLIISFFFLTSCISLKYEYDENGKISKKGFVSKKGGPILWSAIYEDGIKNSSLYYLPPICIMTFYYKNGKVQSRISCNSGWNDKYSNIDREYYQNGKLKSRGHHNIFKEYRYKDEFDSIGNIESTNFNWEKKDKEGWYLTYKCKTINGLDNQFQVNIPTEDTVKMIENTANCLNLHFTDDLFSFEIKEFTDTTKSSISKAKKKKFAKKYFAEYKTLKIHKKLFHSYIEVKDSKYKLYAKVFSRNNKIYVIKLESLHYEDAELMKRLRKLVFDSIVFRKNL